MDDDAREVLVTVRDWLRYGVSRFTAAGLVYGHGTQTALDEAAFLILHTLNLPIDQLDPWLDARLLPQERGAVADVLDARIATRKPAPYLTHVAYMQGHPFYVDERVIVPRSFIGELLASHFGEDGLIGDPQRVGRAAVAALGAAFHQPGRLHRIHQLGGRLLRHPD